MTHERPIHSAQVRQTYDALHGVLGDSFSLDALRLVIAAHRQKPLRIEEQVLPTAITGYCIALRDVDLVCSRQGLSPATRLMAQLHELAHIVLGHLPDVSIPLAYAEFIHTRASLTHTICRDHASRSAAQEQDAELLATLLYAAIQRDAAIPARLRDVIGDPRTESQ